MRKLWFTKRAVSLHIALVIFVPGFLYLGDWQLHRALSGNGLSWAYTFEWPIFAAYAIYMWWRIVHDQGEPETKKPRGARSMNRARRKSLQEESADADLLAYTAYLQSLRDEDRQRHHR